MYKDIEKVIHFVSRYCVRNNSYPLEIAQIILRIYPEYTLLNLAMLYYTVDHTNSESTKESIKRIKENFGDNIAQKISDIVKFSVYRYVAQDLIQINNFTKDLDLVDKITNQNVLFIKLASLLHNLSIFNSDYCLSRDQISVISLEILEVYLPLMSGSNIENIRAELQEFCAKLLNPDSDKDIKKYLGNIDNTQKLVSDVVDVLNKDLDKSHIKAEISGRIKSYYSIWCKLYYKNVNIEKINDIVAFRVIVNDIDDCYDVLKVVHNRYKFLPDKFHDFIDNPKSNGYQSLHTIIIGPGSQKIEIQIRTTSMHNVAQHGSAAHWRYKNEFLKIINTFASAQKLYTSPIVNLNTSTISVNNNVNNTSFTVTTTQISNTYTINTNVIGLLVIIDHEYNYSNSIIYKGIYYINTLNPEWDSNNFTVDQLSRIQQNDIFYSVNIAEVDNVDDLFVKNEENDKHITEHSKTDEEYSDYEEDQQDHKHKKELDSVVHQTQAHISHKTSVNYVSNPNIVINTHTKALKLAEVNIPVDTPMDTVTINSYVIIPEHNILFASYNPNVRNMMFRDENDIEPTELSPTIQQDASCVNNLDSQIEAEVGFDYEPECNSLPSEEILTNQVHQEQLCMHESNLEPNTSVVDQVRNISAVESCSKNHDTIHDVAYNTEVSHGVQDTACVNNLDSQIIVNDEMHKIIINILVELDVNPTTDSTTPEVIKILKQLITDDRYNTISNKDRDERCTYKLLNSYESILPEHVSSFWKSNNDSLIRKYITPKLASKLIQFLACQNSQPLLGNSTIQYILNDKSDQAKTIIAQLSSYNKQDLKKYIDLFMSICSLYSSKYLEYKLSTKDHYFLEAQKNYIYNCKLSNIRTLNLGFYLNPPTPEVDIIEDYFTGTQHLLDDVKTDDIKFMQLSILGLVVGVCKHINIDEKQYKINADQHYDIEIVSNIINKLINKYDKFKLIFIMAMNLEDNDGNTPIMLALKEGRFPMVMLLMGYGVINLNVKNKHGETPLSIAFTSLCGNGTINKAIINILMHELIIKHEQELSSENNEFKSFVETSHEFQQFYDACKKYTEKFSSILVIQLLVEMIIIPPSFMENIIIGLYYKSYIGKDDKFIKYLDQIKIEDIDIKECRDIAQDIIEDDHLKNGFSINQPNDIEDVECGSKGRDIRHVMDDSLDTPTSKLKKLGVDIIPDSTISSFTDNLHLLVSYSPDDNTLNKGWRENLWKILNLYESIFPERIHSFFKFKNNSLIRKNITSKIASDLIQFHACKNMQPLIGHSMIKFILNGNSARSRAIVEGLSIGEKQNLKIYIDIFIGICLRYSNQCLQYKGSVQDEYFLKKRRELSSEYIAKALSTMNLKLLWTKEFQLDKVDYMTDAICLLDYVRDGDIKRIQDTILHLYNKDVDKISTDELLIYTKDGWVISSYEQYRQYAVEGKMDEMITKDPDFKQKLTLLLNNSDDDGNTLIMIAIKEGRFSVVMLLISYGVINLNVKNKDNDTPLSIAFTLLCNKDVINKSIISILMHELIMQHEKKLFAENNEFKSFVETSHEFQQFYDACKKYTEKFSSILVIQLLVEMIIIPPSFMENIIIGLYYKSYKNSDDKFKKYLDQIKIEGIDIKECQDMAQAMMEKAKATISEAYVLEHGSCIDQIGDIRDIKPSSKDLGVIDHNNLDSQIESDNDSNCEQDNNLFYHVRNGNLVAIQDNILRYILGLGYTENSQVHKDILEILNNKDRDIEVASSKIYDLTNQDNALKGFLSLELSIRDNDGNSLIMIAIKKGIFPMVELLRYYNDLNVKNNDNDTALSIALELPFDSIENRNIIRIMVINMSHDLVDAIEKVSSVGYDHFKSFIDTNEYFQQFYDACRIYIEKFSSISVIQLLVEAIIIFPSIMENIIIGLYCKSYKNSDDKFKKYLDHIEIEGIDIKECQDMAQAMIEKYYSENRNLDIDSPESDNLKDLDNQECIKSSKVIISTSMYELFTQYKQELSIKDKDKDKEFEAFIETNQEFQKFYNNCRSYAKKINYDFDTESLTKIFVEMVMIPPSIMENIIIGLYYKSYKNSDDKFIKYLDQIKIEGIDTKKSQDMAQAMIEEYYSENYNFSIDSSGSNNLNIDNQKCVDHINDPVLDKCDEPFTLGEENIDSMQGDNINKELDVLGDVQ